MKARACSKSPRMAKLYDRTSDAISLDEIEWILIWASALHRSRRITAQAPATLGMIDAQAHGTYNHLVRIAWRLGGTK
jgi:hypothetical protein